MKKALGCLGLAAGVLFVIVVMGTLVSNIVNNATPTATITDSTIHTNPTTTSATAPTRNPNTQRQTNTPNTTAVPTQGHWVTVATMKGNNNKIGPNFHLSGSPVTLTYSVKGDPTYAQVIIYVMDKGTQLTKDGGIPDIGPTSGITHDTTMLQRESGDYYLQVVSANANWTVTIQELKN